MHSFSVPKETGFKMHLPTNLLYNTADRGAGTSGGVLGKQE